MKKLPLLLTSALVITSLSSAVLADPINVDNLKTKTNRVYRDRTITIYVNGDTKVKRAVNKAADAWNKSGDVRLVMINNENLANVTINQVAADNASADKSTARASSVSQAASSSQANATNESDANNDADSQHALSTVDISNHDKYNQHATITLNEQTTHNHQVLLSVLEHDFGHLLGLNHSKNKHSVMNPQAGQTVTKNDLNNLRNVYQKIPVSQGN